jgi:hypothetical protein
MGQGRKIYGKCGEILVSKNLYSVGTSELSNGFPCIVYRSITSSEIKDSASEG